MPTPDENWCPCGHTVGDMERCIDGRIYGPCSSPDCGGVCEYYSPCTSPDCRCKEKEAADADA